MCGGPKKVNSSDKLLQLTLLSLEFNNYCKLYRIIFKKGGFTVGQVQKSNISIEKNILGWKPTTS